MGIPLFFAAVASHHEDCPDLCAKATGLEASYGLGTAALIDFMGATYSDN